MWQYLQFFFKCFRQNSLKKKFFPCFSFIAKSRIITIISLKRAWGLLLGSEIYSKKYISNVVFKGLFYQCLWIEHIYYGTLSSLPCSALFQPAYRKRYSRRKVNCKDGMHNTQIFITLLNLSHTLAHVSSS